MVEATVRVDIRHGLPACRYPRRDACHAASTSASRSGLSRLNTRACRSAVREKWNSSVAAVVSASDLNVRPFSTSGVRSKRANPSNPSRAGRYTGISA